MSAAAARRQLAATLVLALVLLATIAPGGWLAVSAALIVLLLGEAPARRGAWELAPVLALVLGLTGGVLSLLQTLSLGGPPGLAAMARLGCLLSATLLRVTRPTQLALHVLAPTVALWTATALAIRPSPLTWSLTLATLIGSALALAASHARGLAAAAESSLVTGMPPGPRHATPPWLPGLVVVAVGALPLALGVELPHPLGARTPAAAPAPRNPGSRALPGPPSPRQVGFEPELGFDAREGLEFDAQVVARVRATPPDSSLMLRGAALERVSSRGFFPRSGPPLEPELLQTLVRRFEVELLSEQRGYLFMVGRPLAVQGVRPTPRPGGAGAPANARYPLRYVIDSEVLHPRFLVRGLPTWDDEPTLLALPTLERKRLSALALEAVGDAVEPYERARRLERWLRQRCDYDPGQPLLGRELGTVVTTFLLESRRGVCVEFAASLAVLLRVLGIPARVIAGYRSDERDAEGWFVVRARHAHAWVEVPFAGAGWVAFDATPAAPGHIPFGATPTPDAEIPPPSEVPPAAATPTATLPPPPVAQPEAVGSPHLALLSLLCLVTCAGLAWHSRWALRRHALRASLEASTAPPALEDARARLFALLAAQGFRAGSSETPLAFVARLDPAAPLSRAVAGYTRLRFSGHDDPRAHQELEQLIARARAETATE